MEFVQLQINYLDWESEWIQSRACYEVAERHGVPVVVMEPIKGGTLAQVPAQAEALLKGLDPSRSVASWAIRFVASPPNVMCVLSGMSSLEQMEDNLSYMDDFQPLSDEERQACFKVASIINGQTAIACTACHSCHGSERHEDARLQARERRGD
ncbi:MAG: aldo/keto reductase [Coriobacteriales bacterium]|nr:aldo/keto reductase [Coriobacteriales bacterium]